MYNNFLLNKLQFEVWDNFKLLGQLIEYKIISNINQYVESFARMNVETTSNKARFLNPPQCTSGICKPFSYETEGYGQLLLG